MRLSLLLLLLLAVLRASAWSSRWACSPATTSRTPVPRARACRLAATAQLNAAGEAFLSAGECFALAANRLPHFFSSKQGLTDENPAVFGGGGLAFTNAGEVLLADGAAAEDSASDLFFAACQLEPLELGVHFEGAGAALEDSDPSGAQRELEAAADDVHSYGVQLADAATDDGESAGALLQRAAAALRVAATALGGLSPAVGRAPPVTMSATRSKLRLPSNVAGPLFVDSSCINCDTCRWMAPETFGHASGQSYVHCQPEEKTERSEALRAMVACPTGSIRFTDRHDGNAQPRMRDVAASFPTPIDASMPNVLHAGYHSSASFGATPYLLAAAATGGANVLIDAPRFNSKLAARFEEMGGLDWILLTHMDDVADHARWAARFPDAQRVMHALDVRDASSWPYIDMTDVEIQLSGDGPWELTPGLTALHTPGHSRGHLCFLASGALTGGNGALFTGDHLAFSGRLGRLDGFARYGWDLTRQVGSIRKLAKLPFQWILPGHGRRAHFASENEREAAVLRCADEFARDPHGNAAPGPVYRQPM